MDVDCADKETEEEQCAMYSFRSHVTHRPDVDHKHADLDDTLASFTSLRILEHSHTHTLRSEGAEYPDSNDNTEIDVDAEYGDYVWQSSLLLGHWLMHNTYVCICVCVCNVCVVMSSLCVSAVIPFIETTWRASECWSLAVAQACLACCARS